MITDVLKWLFKLNIIVTGKLRDSEDILLNTMVSYINDQQDTRLQLWIYRPEMLTNTEISQFFRRSIKFTPSIVKIILV